MKVRGRAGSAQNHRMTILLRRTGLYSVTSQTHFRQKSADPPSVDVVMGLVSGMESETGRTAPWCGEGARTGVKWPGTFPTT